MREKREFAASLNRYQGSVRGGRITPAFMTDLIAESSRTKHWDSMGNRRGKEGLKETPHFLRELEAKFELFVATGSLERGQKYQQT